MLSGDIEFASPLSHALCVILSRSHHLSGLFPEVKHEGLGETPALGPLVLCSWRSGLKSECLLPAPGTAQDLQVSFALFPIFPVRSWGLFSSFLLPPRFLTGEALSCGSNARGSGSYGAAGKAEARNRILRGLLRNSGTPARGLCSPRRSQACQNRILNPPSLIK